MERKKLIFKKDLSVIDENIPRFAELSVKYFWPLMKKERADLMLYFPDYGLNQLPDKAYLFNILNTKDQANFLSVLEALNQQKRGSPKRGYIVVQQILGIFEFFEVIFIDECYFHSKTPFLSCDPKGKNP